MLGDALLSAARQRIRERARPRVLGKVTRVVGLRVEVSMPDASLGDLVSVESSKGELPCEIVGFEGDIALAVALGSAQRIRPGASVSRRPEANSIPVGLSLLGRTIDPFGRPLDGRLAPRCRERTLIDRSPPSVFERAPVSKSFHSRIRVIDGLLTCGRGQRVGIFAGAGVGKSVLVEQIAKHSAADVRVLGLIGERGREVHAALAEAGESNVVTVAATSDRSPMERVRGARAATAVAEHFRDQGANVLLIIDSLTRFAMALREIGLSMGEPPATKGYPPSVFAEMPRLLERVAPMAHGGAITAFYTVLVEGDDLSDPVADSARSLLDGHIVLSRELAGRGHFPAVDVLASASRVIGNVVEGENAALVQAARELLGRRQMIAELLSLGAYSRGDNPEYDAILELGERVDAWSRQAVDEEAEYTELMTRLRTVFAEAA